MKRRREETFTAVGRVEVLKESAKAYLCKFIEEDPVIERWVPKSQLPPGLAAEVGEQVELEVSEWYAGKLEEGEAPRDQKWVEVPDVVVMRETDKAIQVRVGARADQAIWVPKSHLKPGSVVLNEGDSGTMSVSEFIAKEKGFGPGGSGGLTAGEDARRKPADQRQTSFDDDLDDLKF